MFDKNGEEVRDMGELGEIINARGGDDKIKRDRS